MPGARFKFKWLQCFLLCCLAIPAPAQAREILVWNRVAIGHPVIYALLVETFEVTVEDFGDYAFALSSDMEQERAVRELDEGRLLHVAAFAPTPEREARLLPIRIPVTKGLLGIRLCLIKQGMAAKFAGIRSLRDWQARKLSIGQSAHWPDTPILEANRIAVETSARYLPLFDMLLRQRFDCFSRSVNEVLRELARHGHRGIELEPGLVIVYPLPTFFFVSRKKPELARRIETGLERVIRKGRLDDMIEKGFADVFRAVNLASRVPIHLENPFLTPETAKIVNNPELWFDPLESDYTEGGP